MFVITIYVVHIKCKENILRSFISKTLAFGLRPRLSLISTTNRVNASLFAALICRQLGDLCVYILKYPDMHGQVKPYFVVTSS